MFVCVYENASGVIYIVFFCFLVLSHHKDTLTLILARLIMTKMLEDDLFCGMDDTRRHTHTHTHTPIVQVHK